MKDSWANGKITGVNSTYKRYMNMKGFFATGSIIFSVLILILAFESIGGARFQYFLFYFIWLDSSFNPFFLVMGIAALGAIAGVFFTGLIMSSLKNKDDEEAPGGENF